MFRIDVMSNLVHELLTTTNDLDGASRLRYKFKSEFTIVDTSRELLNRIMYYMSNENYYCYCKNFTSMRKIPRTWE